MNQRMMTSTLKATEILHPRSAVSTSRISSKRSAVYLMRKLRGKLIAKSSAEADKEEESEEKETFAAPDFNQESG